MQFHLTYVLMCDNQLFSFYLQKMNENVVSDFVVSNHLLYLYLKPVSTTM